MSVVTSVLLHIGHDDRSKVDAIGRYMASKNHGGFVDVNDGRIRRGLFRRDPWYGGEKYINDPLYMAAFNGLDIEGLIDFVRSLEYAEPEAIQLMILHEDDCKYRVIDLFPDAQSALAKE